MAHIWSSLVQDVAVGPGAQKNPFISARVCKSATNFFGQKCIMVISRLKKLVSECDML
jgi:hypothetical protein